MSLYAAADEHRIRLQARVREWTKSMLLDAAQGAALDAELRVDVRRTNVFLRAGLAVFTTLIVAASVSLTVVMFNLDHPIPTAVVSSIAAIACIALAQYLVVAQRFYRFGVEEALAVMSVALLAIAAGMFTDAQHIDSSGDAPMIAALLAGAAGGLCVYWRFGYVYAAIGGIVCAAAVPFQLGAAAQLGGTAASRHALAAAVFAAAVVIAHRRRGRHGDDYPGDDYALMRAAALAGLYLTLNLQFRFWWTRPDIAGAFYWFTYAMIWALPLAAVVLAIRGRDRSLLAVGLAMALVTVMTNKPYLGWPRHEWDPMLLGVFLMAVAIVVRRWLAAGGDGQRAGFTAARILSSQSGAVTLVGTASAVLHPGAPSYPESEDFVGRGGASGGGGASGTF
ncbi:MAG TPA: hypothetical protein VGI12_03750 [Vicinamibacterales bacterium]